MPSSEQSQKFDSFNSFYPHYLSEHDHHLTRRCHFIGTCLGLLCLVMALITARPQYIAYGLVCGYGFGWLGHYLYIGNKPTTFRHPFYSFFGDLRMFWDMLSGKLKF